MGMSNQMDKCPVCEGIKRKDAEYCRGCTSYKERREEDIKTKKRIAKFGPIGGIYND